MRFGSIRFALIVFTRASCRIQWRDFDDWRFYADKLNTCGYAANSGTLYHFRHSCTNHLEEAPTTPSLLPPYPSHSQRPSAYFPHELISSLVHFISFHPISTYTRFRFASLHFTWPCCRPSLLLPHRGPPPSSSRPPFGDVRAPFFAARGIPPVAPIIIIIITTTPTSAMNGYRIRPRARCV